MTRVREQSQGVRRQAQCQQRAFLFGDAEKSAREGFLFYIKNDLRAVKWRDWKAS